MKPIGMIPCFFAARSRRLRAVARLLVLEMNLSKARERVPHVRRVVYGQAPPTLRIDVREGTVRELRALPRA
jgi:hypothetical protein